MTATGHRNPSHRSNRGRNTGGNRKYVRKFDTWEPRSREDDELMNRFAAEPAPPQLYLNINGDAIEVPRYNGVAWWFPQSTENRAEKFLYVAFTVVNTMQTLCLFVWAAVLVYHLRWLALLAFALTVPLGNQLEDSYGRNYGTAYTSLNVVRLAMYTLKALLARKSSSEDSSEPTGQGLLVAVTFVAVAFVVGNMMSIVEKYIFGRTWNAALLAYVELAFWFYCLWGMLYRV